MGLIEFHQVFKKYTAADQRAALSDVSIVLEPGTFTAITGPSGSGKTTMLNLAAGLDDPTSGWVSVLGKRFDKMSGVQRAKFRLGKMGFVFQAYNLLPVLNARENVEFAALLQGHPPRVARDLALNALEKVGLAGFEDRKPSALSGGQQQRVAVARALANSPEIVFADEPTANLDSENAFQLIDLFKRLNRENNISFIFSTHDNRLIGSVNQCLSMEDGKISNFRSTHGQAHS